MRRIFADAFYWVAIANRNDQWHAEVKALARSFGQVMLVTTEEVLDEFLTHFTATDPLCAASRSRPSKEQWPTRL